MDFYNFIELDYEELLKERDKYLEDTKVDIEAFTFKGLRDYICTEDKYIQSFYKQANDLYQSRRDSKKYNAEYLKQTKKDLLKEVTDYAEEIKGKVKDRIFFNLTQAKDRVMEALNKEPNNEQVNFLNLIKNNKALTKNEVEGLIEKFVDNYMAMRTFQSILEEKGFYLRLPKSYDYDEMLKSLDFAKSYLDKVMLDFGKERKDFKHNEARLFLKNWNHPENINDQIDTIYQNKIIDVLDTSVLTKPKVDLLDISRLNQTEKKVLFDILTTSDNESILKKIDQLNSPKVSKLLSQLSDYQQLVNGKEVKTIEQTQKSIKKVVDRLEGKQEVDNFIDNIKKEGLKNTDSRLKTIQDEKGNDIQVIVVDSAN